MRVGAEHGSVSVVCAAAICIALVCTMGVADVGRVLVERSHAEAAADAAALAAAQDLALGTGRSPSGSVALRRGQRRGAGRLLVRCGRARGGRHRAPDVLRLVACAGLARRPGASPRHRRSAVGEGRCGLRRRLGGMTSRRQLEELLAAVADHGVDPSDAADRLVELPFHDLGFARVDTHRELRQGAPEVILGSGKTPEQAARIALALAEAGASSVLVTRADEPMRSAVREVLPEALEDERARAVWAEREPIEQRGQVSIVLRRHVGRPRGARGADPGRPARHTRRGARGRGRRGAPSPRSRALDDLDGPMRRGRRGDGRRARQRDRRPCRVPGDRRPDERGVRLRARR